jgi:hypothetical protein
MFRGVIGSTLSLWLIWCHIHGSWAEQVTMFSSMSNKPAKGDLQEKDVRVRASMFFYLVACVLVLVQVPAGQ